MARLLSKKRSRDDITTTQQANNAFRQWMPRFAGFWLIGYCIFVIWGDSSLLRGIVEQPNRQQQEEPSSVSSVATNENRTLITQSTPTTNNKHPLEIDFPEEGYLYVPVLPAPDEEWPQASSMVKTDTTQYNKNKDQEQLQAANSGWDPNKVATISTGVPAILAYEQDFAKLMQSIANQTVPAQEVVMVMSKMLDQLIPTNEDHSQACQRIYNHMRVVLDSTSRHKDKIRLKLVCVKERVTAGHARNTIQRIATSDVVAFVDADDTELAHRNALLRQQFTCFPKRILVMGTFERKKKATVSTSVMDSCATEDLPYNPNTSKDHCTGSKMYQLTYKRQAEGFFWQGLAPGHIAVRRKAVLGYISQTSMHKGEDYSFIQDVLYAYGKHRADDTLIVLTHQPMTNYPKQGRSTRLALTEGM